MITFLPFSFARNSIKTELHTASVKLEMLDASVCLSTCFYTLTKPIQTLYQVTKSFISYRLCMSIYLPTSLLESEKHQRFARSLNVGPFLIPRRPIHTAKGPGTPKLGRMFLVSVRERERERERGGEGVITSTQFTCFPRPIFFSSTFFNRSNFEARSTRKEQRNKKETMDRIQYSFSFLSHFSLTLVLIPPYLSQFVCCVRLNDGSDCDL